MSAEDSPQGSSALASSVGGELIPAHVEAVFREFLGRSASLRDVEVWMGVGSLRALLDGVLASEEYDARVAKRTAEEGHGTGLFVNCWTPELAGFCRPPGTVSPDGVSVVGAEGHLFLYGGSNDNLAMYRGEIAMAPDWLEQWHGLVEERVEQARAMGRPLCCLVVPDKLAVYGDLFPQVLETGSPRPVMRLLADGTLPLLYPHEMLREARGGQDTYLMTDSHLTVFGNRLLAMETIEALGAPRSLLDGVADAVRPLVSSGDLGRHFAPPVVEVSEHLLVASAASLASDNWPAIAAAGGHIGTVRVFRREDAADGRTVVVFGDSYGFGDDAYPGLSWFLAQIFREVHFVWVPFGWDPAYLDCVGAQLVVCQTAERFIARVPRARVDVRALAQESARTGGALGLEKVFGDGAGDG